MAPSVTLLTLNGFPVFVRLQAFRVYLSLICSRAREFIELRRKDSEWYVLNMHKQVLEILSCEGKFSGEHLEPDEIVKRGLASKGFEGISAYIEHGEEKEINKRTALRTRKIWFDLGELPKPPIMLPEVYWKKAQVLYNGEKLTLDKRLYSVWPKDAVDVEVLLGILNSDLFLLMREIDGRVEEGQAMNRNSLMVYEAENLGIPDPRRLSKRQAQRIKSAFNKLLEEERSVDEVESRKLYENLNKAVLALIGIEERVEELRKIVDALLNARIRGGGIYAEVTIGVEESARQQIMKMKHALLEEERSPKRKLTLDDFVV